MGLVHGGGRIVIRGVGIIRCRLIRRRGRWSRISGSGAGIVSRCGGVGMEMDGAVRARLGGMMLLGREAMY